jgi:bacillithiol system protein YtxJ
MKIIFKHSYRCSISVRAKEEMDKFLGSHPEEVEFELIDVINNRDRSNEVAQEFGITHESPQIIILDDNGNVTWTASHSRITEKNIELAIPSE